MINVIKKKGINPNTKTELHFLQWTRVSTTVETALAKRMARGGTYSVGEASGVMLDFPEYIIDELLNGNAVSVSGLGTFKLKVSGKADADPEKVTTRGAKASVIFEVDPALASRIETEAEFKVVTTPTPEGQKDADSASSPSTTGSDDNTEQPASGGNQPAGGGGENEDGEDNGGGGNSGGGNEND